jgi:hypothetical protein
MIEDRRENDVGRRSECEDHGEVRRYRSEVRGQKLTVEYDDFVITVDF